MTETEKQEKLRSQIDSVLNTGYLMSLATIDEDGPWVADVLYVHDDKLNLYWVSRKSRRHSKAIRNDGRVACAITVSGKGEKDLGVQLNGKAKELPTLPKKIDEAYWKKRGEGPKLPITEEHAWYQLTPTKIELIDETNFDHEKQMLSL